MELHWQEHCGAEICPPLQPPHWGPSGGISKAGGSPEDVEDTDEPLL